MRQVIVSCIVIFKTVTFIIVWLFFGGTFPGSGGGGIRGVFKRIGIRLGLQILIFLAKDYLRPYLVKTIRNNPFLWLSFVGALLLAVVTSIIGTSYILRDELE